MKFEPTCILGDSLRDIVTIKSDTQLIPFRFKSRISAALKDASHALFGNKDILKSPWVNKHKRAKLILGAGILSSVSVLAIPLKIPKAYPTPYQELYLEIQYSNGPVVYHLKALYKVENIGWQQIAGFVGVREMRELIKAISTDQLQ